jgi:hypothetical protein
MKSTLSCHQTVAARGAAGLFSLFLALVLLGATAFAQAGFTGIFGGGPLYINATNNINELKNSGFTEVIVLERGGEKQWRLEFQRRVSLRL